MYGRRRGERAKIFGESTGENYNGHVIGESVLNLVNFTMYKNKT